MRGHAILDSAKILAATDLTAQADSLMAKATRRVLLSLIVPLLPSFAFGGEPIASFVRSLDGQGWRIATDPNNEGREAKWF